MWQVVNFYPAHNPDSHQDYPMWTNAHKNTPNTYKLTSIIAEPNE